MTSLSVWVLTTRLCSLGVESMSGQPSLHRENRGRRAGTDIEFGQDVADVPVNGPFAQAQLGGDFSVGPTVDDQPQNLSLPWTQPRSTVTLVGQELAGAVRVRPRAKPLEGRQSGVE